MSDRSKEVSTTGLVLTAALGIGLALLWVNRHRKLSINKNSLAWLRNKLNFNKKQVIIITNREQCISAINKIVSECRDWRYVGFDCEWQPQRQKGSKPHPVALLQLATHKGTCALFRLCQIGFIPEEVKAVLRDPTILKVGVAPMDDAKFLHRDFGANVNGCLDLRFLYQSEMNKSKIKQSETSSNESDDKMNQSQESNQPEACYEVTRRSSVTVNQSETRSISVSQSTTMSYYIQSGGLGLARMAYNLLGVELDKNWRVRCSDWEANTLTPRQVEYAANDALVSVLMFEKLNDISSSWWPPWQSKKPSVKWAQVWQKCAHFVDVRPMFRRSETVVTRERMLLEIKRRPMKNVHRKMSTRKRPLYDNCFLQAPDGEVLCTCDRKKADWYVTNELAEVVDSPDGSFVVRLKFEPSGRGGESKKYYTLRKQNVCVVCGKEDSHLRKNVVPHQYRKYFPSELKDHQSHDVLLLCVKCTSKANASETFLRNNLARLCDAPIVSKKNVKAYHDPQLNQVRSAAKALLTSRALIPEWRVLELQEKVAVHFNVTTQDLTVDHLKEASSLDVLVENSSYEPHGCKVVQFFQSREDGLFDLEKMWRQHFLDCMKPKYLPELWSIDHKL